MQGLEEFKNVPGLVPGISKSTAFFCNVPNALKTTILNSMPFAEGSLPVRYLGVPLILSKLLYKDCKILVEKLESCINDWRNKFLSISGRLQLVRSVLSSMHIYWAFVFILPARIIHDLEQLMGGFLWCQGDWHDLCHIRDMLTIRDITRSGFSLADFVSDCISNGHWRWPPDWLDRISGLSSIPVPNLIFGFDDVCLWRDSQGNHKPFSVAYAWDFVRLRADVVDWYHLVWFPQCIPRHAFHLWLVAKQKLKTQDRLRQWDVGPSVVSGSWSRWYGSNPPRFADISAYLIPSSKGTSVIVQEEGVYRSSDCPSYYFYGSFEAGYLQVQEGVYSVSFFIRSMEDSKLLFGSQKEFWVRVVLFFPSPRFFPLGFSWEGFLRRQPYLGRLLALCCCWRARRADVAVFQVP
ncbi:reverse transcriptase domain, reverse transcriptase zinc-binding domain protein [Tanacetum coccineum]